MTVVLVYFLKIAVCIEQKRLRIDIRYAELEAKLPYPYVCAEHGIFCEQSVFRRTPVGERKYGLDEYMRFGRSLTDRDDKLAVDAFEALLPESARTARNAER